MQGEHTREVMAEVGYSATEIEAMLAQGLIADRSAMKRLKAAQGSPQE